MTIDGYIIDENNITLSGTGSASGTVEGAHFSCTGSATGIFTRQYDLAVAILRGGSSSFGSIDNFFEGNRWLENIRQQCEENDRVIAKTFRSNSSVNDVTKWLNKINSMRRECGEYESIPVILVGHSWGGYTALNVAYSNVCCRILIDYWDADQWHGLTNSETIFNQRELEPETVTVEGKVINYLAELPSPPFNLLGRRLSERDNVTQIGPIEGTTHASIVEAVARISVFIDEIENCLSNDYLTINKRNVMQKGVLIAHE